MHLAVGGQDQRRNKKSGSKYDKGGSNSGAKDVEEGRHKSVRLLKRDFVRFIVTFFYASNFYVLLSFPFSLAVLTAQRFVMHQSCAGQHHYFASR